MCITFSKYSEVASEFSLYGCYKKRPLKTTTHAHHRCTELTSPQVIRHASHLNYTITEYCYDSAEEFLNERQLGLNILLAYCRHSCRASCLGRTGVTVMHRQRLCSFILLIKHE